MEKEKFDLGYVVTNHGKPNEQRHECTSLLRMKDDSGRTVSISGLNNDCFAISLDNTALGLEPHQHILLTRDSFIAILAAGSIYFLEKGEEELYRNESVSYLEQEGLVIDFRVRE